MEQNLLIDFLNLPLPSKNDQRKLKYKPIREHVDTAYQLLNYYIFDGKLIQPSINFRTMEHLGVCNCYYDDDGCLYTKIKIANKFSCIQWMVVVLAHEMVHQYQWEVDGPERIANKKPAIASHCKSFYCFRDKFAKFGIPLKRSYSHEDWIKHQNLMKI